MGKNDKHKWRREIKDKEGERGPPASPIFPCKMANDQKKNLICVCTYGNSTHFEGNEREGGKSPVQSVQKPLIRIIDSVDEEQSEQ